MRAMSAVWLLCLGPALSGCAVDREPGPAVLYVVPVGAAAEPPDQMDEAPMARVELACEPGTRERGLMGRTGLEPDTGMLFVYPEQRVLEFWMKNTMIPLSICYADSSGRIVRILEMEPDPGDGRALPRYPSGAPALYALEMEAGWFGRHGIREGGQILFHPAILAATPR